MNAKKTIIRIGSNTLSFTTLDAASAEHPIKYQPYVVRGGISMSANLREAFKTGEYVDDEASKVQVVIDSPSLLMPIEQFDESEIETVFSYSYPAGQEKRVVMYNVLPDLKAVCLFAINKNLDTVIRDRFDDEVSFIHAMTPVWRQLHQRSFTGHRNKLYGYFHAKHLDIFSFQQNRFKFCNSFDATHAHDALYFLLYVWKQLRLESEHDELHILGDIPEQDWMVQELKRFLHNAYVINAKAEYQEAPATRIKGMPYDLITLITRGR
ncbi:MAG: DUF3822 family protein [Prevotella sp.]|nr:DUF3822 family protein [Prevotella sp.]MBR1556729.1 DUF3822 family protein [Prevotella sp.]